MRGRPRKISSEIKPQPIETHLLLNYNEFRAYSAEFIETGSCYGDGIKRALDAGYERVISVEAQQELFDHCMTRFKNDNVRLFCGKSTDRLKEIMAYAGDKPLVIFLDAHPAGEKTFGHEEVSKDKDHPELSQHAIISKELEIILSHRNDHVIIIDDINGMNAEAEQYIEFLSKSNPNYQFYFYDECLENGIFYKNKSLIAKPY